MKTILVDAVDTFVIEGEWIFREMYELLEEYKNPKMILTNANKEQMKIFWLENLPYPLFTLAHNPDKPDPKYFEIFLAKNKLGVEDVIYFEHNPAACKSAESLWIKTHFYDAEKKGLQALKEFLDTYL